MSRILTFLGMSAFLVLIACNGQSEKQSEHQEADVKEAVAKKTYYYTCPMDEHTHIASNEAGACSACGMDLVAATEVSADSADYFGCPMSQHSHIRHDKAGKCGECNMDLKPMRLVKE